MAKGYTLTITAQETSYSVTANTSNVSVSVQANRPSSSTGAWKYDSTTLYITCNGMQKAVNVPSYDFTSSATVSLGSSAFENIQHNADGTKTITISASWYSANTYVQDSSGSTTLTGSTTLALTDIPRQALIKTVADFTDEQNPTITYQNYGGDNVTSLQACISLDGASADISYRDIEINGTSYTFSLTDDERITLRNATTNNSRSVTFIIKTILSGETYTSSMSSTMKIVNANPVINSVTYKDINSTTTAITGNNQHIVQGKSQVRVVVASPTLLKGASFSKWEITLNSTTKTLTSASGNVDFGSVDSASDLILTVVCTDSRGNSSKTTQTVTVFEYYTPTATVELYRQNNYEDTTYLTVDGSIASVNSKNTITVKYQYKVNGGSYNSASTISNKAKTTISLDKNNEYIFKITVSDKFGGTFTGEYTLPKGVFPLFIDTGKNSIGINTLPTHEKSLEVVSKIYLNDTDIEDTFALKDHTHDERYYTEAEIDTKLSEIGYNLIPNGDAVKVGYKINGKDVYAKMISFTTALSSSSTFSIAHNIGSYTKAWVDYSRSYIDYGSSIGFFSMPTTYYNNTMVNTIGYINGTKLYVRSSYGWNAYNTKVFTILYY